MEVEFLVVLFLLPIPFLELKIQTGLESEETNREKEGSDVKMEAFALKTLAGPAETV